MEAPSPDIETLIRESVGGNTERYRELYEHMVDRIFAYVRSRTGTHEAATDITQDVFVDLWKALPTFTYHSREQFYAFVFVITKRKLSHHYGAESLRATAPLDEATLEANDVPRPGNEEADELARALTTLDPLTRDIMVLHHWSRYTFGEIAHLINMTESAVRVRHHRALATLQKNLTHPRHRQSYE